MSKLDDILEGGIHTLSDEKQVKQDVKNLMLELNDEVNKRAKAGNWTQEVRDSYFRQKVNEL